MSRAGESVGGHLLLAVQTRAAPATTRSATQARSARKCGSWSRSPRWRRRSALIVWRDKLRRRAWRRAAAL